MVAFLSQTLKPLTYGQVKSSKDVIDGLTAAGLDLDARIAAAVAFLRLTVPDADFDAATPAEIQQAALALYTATFHRPEETAPAPQNP